MKDRGRNTRRHAYVAPASKPWNRCPSCRELVDLPEPCFDGATIDCPCGLELTATCFEGGDWELIVVTCDVLDLDRETHVCDFCGEEEPCLCRPEAEDGDPDRRDCGGCGYCDDCVVATNAHMEDAERAEAEPRNLEIARHAMFTTTTSSSGAPPLTSVEDVVSAVQRVGAAMRALDLRLLADGLRENKILHAPPKLAEEIASAIPVAKDAAT